MNINIDNNINKNIENNVNKNLDNDINIYDPRSALTGLYLWLLFGYLSSMVSCDMQKFMTDNILLRHFISIIAFFFLFTIIENPNNTLHIGVIWKKTLVIYVIFLMMIKSKWYFSLPILFVLVLDQTIKSHINYLEAQKNTEDIILYNKYRDILYKLLFGLIITGFIHYGYRQFNEHEKDFSLSTFLFSSTCKKI
jgi:hypothetical protein